MYNMVRKIHQINCDQLICYSDIRYKNLFTYSNILPDSIHTVLTSDEVNLNKQQNKTEKELNYFFRY